MSRDDVLKKSRDLVEPILGKAKATRLLDQLMNLEKIADIRTLRPSLQTG